MRLMLLSQVAADKAFFEDVASRANIPLQQFSNVVALTDELARDPASLVVIDATTQALYSAFENSVADKLGLYSAVVNPNYYFFVANAPLHSLSYLQGSQIFGSFVQRTYQEDTKELFAQVMSRAASESPFSIEKYFSPMAKLQVTPLKKSVDKAAVIEALKDFLLRWGMNSRAAVVVANSLDELLMNAIYDAPVDELGKPLYLTTPRNTPLDLVDRSQVEVKIVHDETSLGVSVSDQYGSLDRTKLLSALGKSYRNEEYRVKSNVAGAGLGLADAYLHSGGAVFAWEPGNRSEIMLFFKKTSSFKEFREQFRFLTTISLST